MGQYHHYHRSINRPLPSVNPVLYTSFNLLKHIPRKMASLPAILSPPLNPREAITDALYRCLIGIDLNDAALFDSAWTPTSTFANNGKVSAGLEAIHTDMFDRVAAMDTTHYPNNIRINIAEDGVNASLTATVLAQHYRPGKGMEPGQTRLLAGAFYSVDLVKDGEVWKIQTFDMKLSWAEGDWGVMTGQ
ncbi:hypothetical protein BJX99DRAFT_235851 [Aspergillus californicus]